MVLGDSMAGPRSLLEILLPVFERNGEMLDDTAVNLLEARFGSHFVIFCIVVLSLDSRFSSIDLSRFLWACSPT